MISPSLDEAILSTMELADALGEAELGAGSASERSEGPTALEGGGGAMPLKDARDLGAIAMSEDIGSNLGPVQEMQIRQKFEINLKKFRMNFKFFAEQMAPRQNSSHFSKR